MRWDRATCRLLLAAGVVPVMLAQSAKPPAPKAIRPVQAQSTSSITAGVGADGAQTVEIRNVSYEITGDGITGRPAGERLLLRKATHSKQILGDIGVDAAITLEAWRLGDDPAQKPLYIVAAPGVDIHTVDNAILVASRGVEEVDWWSVYQLGSGRHLFDTYVPLVSFSLSPETARTRYLGLEVPPDDTQDARLKQPNVVAVLTYASEDRVIREALLTCDDPRQARLLRSYADVTRTVSAEEKPPSHVLRVAFRQNYPSPANPLEVVIPIAGDDLDLAHAQLPPRMHASAWRR